MSEPSKIPEWDSNDTNTADWPVQYQADGLPERVPLIFEYVNNLFRLIYLWLLFLAGGEFLTDGTLARDSSRPGRTLLKRGTELVNDNTLTIIGRHKIDGSVSSPYPTTVLGVRMRAVVRITDGTGAADLVVQVKVGGTVIASLSKTAAALTTGEAWIIDLEQHIDGTSGTGAVNGGHVIRTKYTGDSEVVGVGFGNENNTTDADIEIEAQWSAADANSGCQLDWLHAVNFVGATDGTLV